MKPDGSKCFVNLGGSESANDTKIFLNGPASRSCAKPDGSKCFVNLGGSESANDTKIFLNDLASQYSRN